MITTLFLERQRRRIQKRIEATNTLIRNKRIDAAFKASKILGSQYRALIRLMAGVYGRCCDCGSNIPLKRLEAVPAAIRCVSCQEDAET